ncbi:MAG: ABC transporter ATP-binding protein [Ardenticatenales bacterium]|nr:ABC transporter ATP-binding protein [Ardenticatenales bacterium]
MMQPAIQFENVSKRFVYAYDHPYSILESVVATLRRQQRAEKKQDDLWAVRDANFTIMPGETVGFIGRNGGGKSTLLKLATRIYEPTSGRIRVHGRTSALLELGAGFHPELTGHENIFLNGALLGLSEVEVREKYDAIVDFSEMRDFLHMPVKFYSSGMYMRLAFSVAVHVEPDILFVDEILAVGDQAFQSKCIDRIYEIKQGGATIVIVSHDLRVVRNLCTRLLWLDKGAIREDGPAGDVAANYVDYSRALEQEQMAKVLGSRENFKRWGSRQVTIESVTLQAKNGTPQATFHTGDDLTIVIRYHAPKRVKAPKFGLSVLRKDGLQLSSPNQAGSGDPIGEVQGHGELCYHIRDLPLLPAEYFLTVSVHDELGLQVYDYHDRAYPFHVLPRGSEKKDGIIELPASWEWRPGGEATD